MSRLDPSASTMKRLERNAQRMGSIIENETPVGVIDGANTVFTLAAHPRENSLKVYLNGIRLVPTTDYTVAVDGTTKLYEITLTTAPGVGDNLLVDYRG